MGQAACCEQCAGDCPELGWLGHGCRFHRSTCNPAQRLPLTVALQVVERTIVGPPRRVWESLGHSAAALTNGEECVDPTAAFLCDGKQPPARQSLAVRRRSPGLRAAAVRRFERQTAAGRAMWCRVPPCRSGSCADLHQPNRPAPRSHFYRRPAPRLGASEDLKAACVH